jgi:hypothetical protein
MAVAVADSTCARSTAVAESASSGWMCTLKSAIVLTALACGDRPMISYQRSQQYSPSAWMS